MALPKQQTKKPIGLSKDFIEAAAMPGVETTQALRIAKVKNEKRTGKKAKTIIENPTDGSPKNGTPNIEKVHAYNKAAVLRNQIEERKRLALEFCDITPEMVLGATAMRAFASIDGAFDEHGRFDIQKARETGAIHLVKRLRQTVHGLDAEFYSNETAQQQLASYMGMEFAPRDQDDDVDSLKAGVEAVSREIARRRKTDITHEIRVEAWEAVRRWAQESKARYSPAAMAEAEKQYGGVESSIKRITGGSVDVRAVEAGGDQDHAHDRRANGATRNGAG